jgi:hypothetical protein
MTLVQTLPLTIPAVVCGFYRNCCLGIVVVVAYLSASGRFRSSSRRLVDWLFLCLRGGRENVVVGFVGAAAAVSVSLCSRVEVHCRLCTTFRTRSCVVVVVGMTRLPMMNFCFSRWWHFTECVVSFGIPRDIDIPGQLIY